MRHGRNDNGRKITEYHTRTLRLKDMAGAPPVGSGSDMVHTIAFDMLRECKCATRDSNDKFLIAVLSLVSVSNTMQCICWRKLHCDGASCGAILLDSNCLCATP